MIKNNTYTSSKHLPSSIKNIKLFKNLSKKSILDITKNTILRNYKNGQTFFQQGDTPSHLYIITDGQIRSFRSNKDGNETTISILNSGDLCMESLVFIEKPSPISLQAIDKARIILLPHKLVKELMLQDKQFATNLLEIIAQNYNGTIQQIDSLTLKTPAQRIGYYLLQKNIAQYSNNTEFKLIFKKSIIANHLGMTPETFSRTIPKIKPLGIKIDGSTINLKDIYTLCSFCDVETAHDCKLSCRKTRLDSQ